jgi:hypothetical protein
MRLMLGFGAFRPLFATLVLVIACSKPTAPPPAPDAAHAVAGEDTQHARCCGQCTSAARRDPSGTNLEPTDCRKYLGQWNGQPGVDDSCFLYFKERQTTVGDCWKDFPASK